MITAVLICTACLENQNKTEASNMNSEEVLKRQHKIYEDAEANPQQFKADLKENCPHFGSALLTTAENHSIRNQGV